MGRQKRPVLLVDGSASSVFYTASMLRSFQYDVKSVGSGEEALAAIARIAPHAVVTEAVLPKMSGLALLQTIKANVDLRFIPVIVNTVDASPEMKQACQRAGCAEYFVKPVEPESLFRAIQKASEATPRKHIRIKTALKAQVGRPGGGQTRIEPVTSLSEGGLYVETIFPFPVDTTLAVTLLLADREVNATVIVLYASAKAGGAHAVPGMGVKFTAIDEADRNLIRDFITRQVMSKFVS